MELRKQVSKDFRVSHLDDLLENGPATILGSKQKSVMVDICELRGRETERVLEFLRDEVLDWSEDTDVEVKCRVETVEKGAQTTVMKSHFHLLRSERIVVVFFFEEASQVSTSRVKGFPSSYGKLGETSGSGQGSVFGYWSLKWFFKPEEFLKSSLSWGSISEETEVCEKTLADMKILLNNIVKSLITNSRLNLESEEIQVSESRLESRGPSGTPGYLKFTSFVDMNKFPKSVLKERWGYVPRAPEIMAKLYMPTWEFVETVLREYTPPEAKRQLREKLWEFFKEIRKSEFREEYRRFLLDNCEVCGDVAGILARFLL